MTTCYNHGDGVHVQHPAEGRCPICVLLSAKDEAIMALSKLSLEEVKALEFLDHPKGWTNVDADPDYIQKDFFKSETPKERAEA